MARTALKWPLILVGTIATLVMDALAVPVKLWRTGEVPQPDLKHLRPARETKKPRRVWVNTDAACGTGQRRDPDECLALLAPALAGAAHIEIADISTVFGNAPVNEADQVTRALVQALGRDMGRSMSAQSVGLSVFTAAVVLGGDIPRFMQRIVNGLTTWLRPQAMDHASTPALAGHPTVHGKLMLAREVLRPCSNVVSDASLPWSTPAGVARQTITLSCLLLVLAVVSGAATAAASPKTTTLLPSDAQLEAMGAVIGHIHISNGDVFDANVAAESGPLYRLANRLHRQTRGEVIRSRLLISEGARYSRRLLDESARLLRAERNIADATVEPESYAAGVVDVRVTTRDIWSLTPGLSFGRKGGQNTFSFEIEELNLLGTGIEIDLEHSSDVDRDGNSVQLVDRSLFGSRYRLEASYADNSDGSQWLLDVGRPFYALDSRWAGGAQLTRTDQIDSFYELGEVTSRYRRMGRTHEGYWGRSAGLIDGWVNRWSIGLSRDQQVFSALPDSDAGAPLPSSRDLTSVWLGMELLQDDFAVWRDRTQMGRAEDVLLGNRLSVRLGRLAQALGGDRDGWIYRIESSRGVRLGKDSTLLLAGDLGGRHESGRSVDQLLNFSARYLHPLTEKSLLYASLGGAWGNALELDHRLELGGDNGLRGYPQRYQSGERNALFTLEHRYFTDWYPLRLFRVGTAVFMDVGRSWGDDGLDTPKLGTLRNVGVGLRLASTRASLGNVIHIDLAFPLDGGDSIDNVQLLLEAKREF